MVVIRCRLSSKNKKLCLLKTLKHGFTKGNVEAFTKKIKNIRYNFFFFEFSNLERFDLFEI